MWNPTRRTLLTGTGAATLATALTGCAAYGDTGVNAAPPPQTGDDPNAPAQPNADAGTAADPPPKAGDAAPPTPLARTADIPVGGGKILADQKIVVTQPAAGTFRCFTAVCTHAGCLVGEVADGTINCPCHGSKFKLTDGSVANGPAKKPLSAIAVKVTGDTISKA